MSTDTKQPQTPVPTSEWDWARSLPQPSKIDWKAMETVEGRNR